MDDQLTLLGTLKREYGGKWDRFPHRAQDRDDDGFFLENGQFGPVDAELLYAMVRHVKPKRIVEVGAGWTTLLILQAIADMGAEGEPQPMFETVDPVAPGFVYDREGVHVNTKRLQEMNILNTLKPGDMLICDTSHIFVEGHEIDVVLQKMEALKGVYVHFHDIFLPGPYPPQWADRGYNEQEHLRAFLEGHPAWQVILAANALHVIVHDALKATFASYDPGSPHRTGLVLGLRRSEPPLQGQPCADGLRQAALHRLHPLGDRR